MGYPMRKIQMPTEHIHEAQIKDMLPGDHRFTLPWAVGLDKYGEPWINSSYPAEREKAGTVSLPIIRVEAGIVLDFLNFDYFGGRDYKWDKGSAQGPGGWHDWKVVGVLTRDNPSIHVYEEPDLSLPDMQELLQLPSRV